MPRAMAPHQLAFWRELLAPFAPNELSEVPARGGKKTLTYIDKRALENRLDSVCGPHGWYAEYEATARGYKCRLFIECPMATPGTWVFMHKEDGAGFEEMGSYNKQTNEWEADVDNDEKSGYTNALRRAAQDAWGIGRYLYNKGIPAFLDPNARPLEPAAPPVPAPAREPARPDPPATAASSPASSTPSSTSSPAPAGNKPAGGFDNFKIPKPGKSVFAWTKEMEKVFETKLVDGMGREGESRGWGKTFADWNEDQVREICMGCIAFIRELPTYKGQYEHLFQANGAAPASAPAQAPAAQPAPAPGVNLADLRKTLMAKMQEHVEAQIGRTAEPVELKAAFAKIAAESPNADGQVGLQPESLAKLTDAVWIRNMIGFVENQIAQSKKASDAGDEEIPF